MPPVLDVALHELAAGAAKQLLAQQRGLGVDERHRVLQLVAEAEGAARLVVAAARPHAARQGLVEEPAVGQHVERRVRRFHLHRAERALQCACTASSAPRAAAGPRKRCTSAASVGGIATEAEPEDDLALLAVGQLDGTWIAAHGSSAAPTWPESRVRAIAAGSCERAIASEESVRSPLTLRAGSSTSKKATRSGNSVL